jgi:hypothetical protein
MGPSRTEDSSAVGVDLDYVSASGADLASQAARQFNRNRRMDDGDPRLTRRGHGDHSSHGGQGGYNSYGGHGGSSQRHPRRLRSDHYSGERTHGGSFPGYHSHDPSSGGHGNTTFLSRSSLPEAAFATAPTPGLLAQQLAGETLSEAESCLRDAFSATPASVAAAAAAAAATSGIHSEAAALSASLASPFSGSGSGSRALQPVHAAHVLSVVVDNRINDAMRRNDLGSILQWVKDYENLGVRPSRAALISVLRHCIGVCPPDTVYWVHKLCTEKYGYAINTHLLSSLLLLYARCFFAEGVAEVVKELEKVREPLGDGHFVRLCLGLMLSGAEDKALRIVDMVRSSGGPADLYISYILDFHSGHGHQVVGGFPKDAPEGHRMRQLISQRFTRRLLNYLLVVPDPLPAEIESFLLLCLKGKRWSFIVEALAYQKIAERASPITLERCLYAVATSGPMASEHGGGSAAAAAAVAAANANAATASAAASVVASAAAAGSADAVAAGQTSNTLAADATAAVLGAAVTKEFFGSISHFLYGLEDLAAGATQPSTSPVLAAAPGGSSGTVADADSETSRTHSAFPTPGRSALIPLVFPDEWQVAWAEAQAAWAEHIRNEKGDAASPFETRMSAPAGTESCDALGFPSEDAGAGLDVSPDLAALLPGDGLALPSLASAGGSEAFAPDPEPTSEATEHQQLGSGPVPGAATEPAVESDTATTAATASHLLSRMSNLTYGVRKRDQLSPALLAGAMYAHGTVAPLLVAPSHPSERNALAQFAAAHSTAPVGERRNPVEEAVHVLLEPRSAHASSAANFLSPAGKAYLDWHQKWNAYLNPPVAVPLQLAPQEKVQAGGSNASQHGYATGKDKYPWVKVAAAASSSSLPLSRTPLSANAATSGSKLVSESAGAHTRGAPVPFPADLRHAYASVFQPYTTEDAVPSYTGDAAVDAQYSEWLSKAVRDMLELPSDPIAPGGSGCPSQFSAGYSLPSPLGSRTNTANWTPRGFQSLAGIDVWDANGLYVGPAYATLQGIPALTQWRHDQLLSPDERSDRHARFAAGILLHLDAMNHTVHPRTLQYVFQALLRAKKAVAACQVAARMERRRIKLHDTAPLVRLLKLLRLRATSSEVAFLARRFSCSLLDAKLYGEFREFLIRADPSVYRPIFGPFSSHEDLGQQLDPSFQSLFYAPRFPVSTGKIGQKPSDKPHSSSSGVLDGDSNAITASVAPTAGPDLAEKTEPSTDREREATVQAQAATKTAKTGRKSTACPPFKAGYSMHFPPSLKIPHPRVLGVDEKYFSPDPGTMQWQQRSMDETDDVI